MDADCLDPATVDLFVDGQLSEPALLRLELHLDICGGCMDLVAAVAASRDSTGNSAGSKTATARPPGIGTALAASLAPGTLLGRYEVRRWLGRGGMGDVYEGFDRHLERRVALKILRDGGGDRELARQRLGREAKSLARLSHPNVVAAHDVGLEGERLFLVMELVEGPTLASWLKTAPRTWRAILDVFLDAGEGLAAAHAVGVVHRDFKPQNVLIGADGKARVSDFGLARSGVGDGEHEVSSGGGSSPVGGGPESLTESGATVGTPRYMAPEQTLGHPVDARSDQFSFAVALYEALFGRHPFVDNAAAKDRTRTEYPKSAVLANRPFNPPSRSKVPRACSTALGRGLASDPALRYDSLGDLLAALRRSRGGGLGVDLSR